MSQLRYFPFSPKISSELSTFTKTSSTSTSTEYHLVLQVPIEEDKPVQIIDDSIEINEDLIKDDLIYPITYDGEQYYVRKKNGATEIFQLID